MNSSLLKYIRIALASIVFILITAYFLDFSSSIPNVHIQDIQLIPAILHSMWIAVGVLLLLTFVMGRVYCSTLCPLGIMMDIISFTSGRGKKKNFKNKNSRYSYTKAHNILRYTLLVVCIATYFISSAFVVILALDPYSNYGRIAQNVFAPIYYSINNAISWFASEVGLHGTYMMGYDTFSWIGSGVSFAVLLLVGYMAYTRGRLWCNTICPTGAFLSLLSRFSLLKITLDKKMCTSCGMCASACKSSCIDHKNKTVDNSRCVVCFNCIERCSRGGVKYSLSLPWKKDKKPADTSDVKKDCNTISRRDFLATGAAITFTAIAAKAASKDTPKSQRRVCALVKECPRGRGCNFNRICYVEGERLPVAPPGALGIEIFNDACTGCHLCIAKCPSGVLVPSITQYGARGFLQPVMRYDGGHFCAYDCNVCGDVCPTGAIRPLTVEQKHSVQVGIAHLFPSKCVAFARDYDCGACAEHCPVGAVHMVVNSRGIPVPEIIPEVCIGCGACEQICPEKAILVYGHKVHRRAQVPEKEEAKEINLDGFGF